MTLTVSVLLLALFVALVVGQGEAWATTVGDVSFVIFPALAAASSLRAAVRRRGRERTAWILLGLAWSTWSTAGLVWTVQGLRGEHPFPSLVDAGFLLYSLPALAGLFLLPASDRDAWSRLRTLLDGVVIGSSLLFLSWVGALGPLVASRQSEGLARVTSLGYPLVDLLTLSVVLTLALRAAPSGRRLWLVFSAGFVSLAVVDTLYVQAALEGTYESGGVTTTLYALAFSLFAVAPQVAGAREPRLARLAAWQESLPYGPLAACVTVAALRTESVKTDVVLLVSFLLLIVAAAARQLLIILEKIRLADDLEERVELRTAELHAEREFLHAVVDNLHDGIVACDADGRLTFFNAATAQFHGTGPQPVPASEWGPLYGLLSPQTLQPLRADQVPLIRALRGEVVREDELVIRSGDGPDKYMSVSGRALRGPDGSVAGAVVAMHDVTQQRQAQAALERRALTDELTGLGNRAQFLDSLAAAMHSRAQTGHDVAVLLLDLDDFKHVNDSLGHHAGDALLVEVASRIRGVLRATDSAARLGGDEFVLLLDAASQRDAVAVAERLLSALDRTVAFDGAELTVSASVGVALADDEHGGQDLLMAADLAMYVAKQRGKGGVAVFERQMQLAALDRLSLESDLRRAVRDERLHLVYQPIVDLQTGALTGVEALVRWQDEVRGFVSPVEFIPIAEETGLILPLGEWVLREAAAQLRRWNDRFGVPDLIVNVNISTRQLERHGLLSTLDDLVRGGLRPAQLVLEITETALSVDDNAAAETLRAIRDRGFHLAVDDFGTGYSSLGRLRSSPVSRLKIDRSFVGEIDSGGSNAPIVDATLAMAQGLGLGVVAEGIETAAQLDYLRQLGCAQAQGYLLARPGDAGAIAAMLQGDLPWAGLIDAGGSGWAGPQQELTRLYDVAVARSSGMEQLVRPLLDELQRLTGLTSTYLTSVTPDLSEQRVEYVSSAVDSGIQEGLSVEWDDSLCRRMLDAGVRRTDDAMTAFEDSRVTAALGIRSFVTEPVYDDSGRLWGTLCGSAQTPVTLSETHSATVRLFAGLIAEKLRDPAAADGSVVPVRRAGANGQPASPVGRLEPLPPSRAGSSGSHDPVFRVMVADDDLLMRQIVAHVIDAEPSLELVAEADNARATIDIAVARQPDLLVLDYELGDADAERVVAELRRRAVGTRILLYSGRSDVHHIGQRLGADRSVCKADGAQRLVEALQAMAPRRPVG